MDHDTPSPISTEDLARGAAIAALTPSLLAIVILAVLGGGYGLAAGVMVAAYLLPVSCACAVLALAPLAILLRIRRLTFGPVLGVSVAIGLLAGWVFRGVDWGSPPEIIALGGFSGIAFGVSLWTLVRPDTPTTDRATADDVSPE